MTGIGYAIIKINGFPSNQVRAAEALSKLVSDLKENLILNDFSTINETTTRRIDDLEAQQGQQVKRMEDMYKLGTAPSSAGGVGGAMEPMEVTLEPRTSWSKQNVMIAIYMPAPCC